jgi:ATP sulfurylase
VDYPNNTNGKPEPDVVKTAAERKLQKRTQEENNLLIVQCVENQRAEDREEVEIVRNVAILRQPGKSKRWAFMLILSIERKYQSP